MKIRAIASSQDEALEKMRISADNVELVSQSLAEFGDSPWYEKFCYTFEARGEFRGDPQYIVDENCEAEYQKALQEYNRRANEAKSYKGLIYPKYEDYC